MLDSCYYCGCGLVPAGPKHPQNEYTIDHILPVSRGGEHVAENMVACCRACNTAKGNHTVEEYRQLVFRAHHSHFKRMAIGMKLASKMHPSHLSFELERLAARFEDANEFVIFEGERNVDSLDEPGLDGIDDVGGGTAGTAVDR